MKIRALILSAAILASAMLVGCSSGSDKKETKETSNTTSKTTSSAQVSSQDSEKKESSASSVSEDSSKESSTQSGTPVEASWFDDSVFIGDSVTLKLSYYAEKTKALGEAEFLCAGSLGYTNALWELDHEDNVHPDYEGEKVTVYDGAQKVGAKKIFVMLGMNDIGLYGVDGGSESMITLTDKIREKNPDAVIYIQSVTPMVAGNSLGDLNNESISQFDEKLQEVCKDKGYKYLDVASAVSDENGDLVYEYCGDPPSDDNPDAMGLHFTDLGCEKWTEYLKSHVQ